MAPVNASAEDSSNPLLRAKRSSNSAGDCSASKLRSISGRPIGTRHKMRPRGFHGLPDEERDASRAVT